MFSRTPETSSESEGSASEGEEMDEGDWNGMVLDSKGAGSASSPPPGPLRRARAQALLDKHLSVSPHFAQHFSHSHYLKLARRASKELVVAHAGAQGTDESGVESSDAANDGRSGANHGGHHHHSRHHRRRASMIQTYVQSVRLQLPSLLKSMHHQRRELRARISEASSESQESEEAKKAIAHNEKTTCIF